MRVLYCLRYLPDPCRSSCRTLSGCRQQCPKHRVARNNLAAVGEAAAQVEAERGLNPRHSLPCLRWSGPLQLRILESKRRGVPGSSSLRTDPHVVSSCLVECNDTRAPLRMPNAYRMRSRGSSCSTGSTLLAMPSGAPGMAVARHQILGSRRSH
jgi:hypothetical protein